MFFSSLTADDDGTSDDGSSSGNERMRVRDLLFSARFTKVEYISRIGFLHVARHGYRFAQLDRAAQRLLRLNVFKYRV